MKTLGFSVIGSCNGPYRQGLIKT